MTQPTSDIKAGDYELLSEVWEQPDPDLKPGEPYRFTRHVKGDTVTLSEEDARRLLPAGAVCLPGERERQAAEAAKAQYLASLAMLPEDVRKELTGSTDLPAADPEPAEPPTDPTPSKKSGRSSSSSSTTTPDTAPSTDPAGGDITSPIV